MATIDGSVKPFTIMKQKKAMIELGDNGYCVIKFFTAICVLSESSVLSILLFIAAALLMFSSP